MTRRTVDAATGAETATSLVAWLCVGATSVPESVARTVLVPPDGSR